MKTVRVYRNPDCPACARYARMHQRLDWLDRVDVSTRTPDNRLPLRLGEVVVEDLRSGLLREGADAFALLARQVPAYWLLLPLLRVPAVRRRVDREMRGACDETCEVSR
jgi:hypothetical protein